MSVELSGNPTSLMDFVRSVAELRVVADERDAGGGERRAAVRFAPADRVVVRLDGRRGVWSAGVLDVSDRAARLLVDNSLADRVSDGEPASVWFESDLGRRSRLEGKLTHRRGCSPALTFMYDA